MIRKTLICTLVTLIALAFYVLQELRFLAPYRAVLWHHYGTAIGEFVVVLFVNVFALFYWLGRYVLLADTGQKLAHLEKQLRTGESLSDELAARLRD